MIPDLRHNFAYTKTVSIPVNKNAHQAQFPATPPFRTISVTKLGVSAEKVVATMEIPSNHQGIFLSPKKNWLVLFEEERAKESPMNSDTTKNAAMIHQSSTCKCIKLYFPVQIYRVILIFTSFVPTNS